MRFRQIHLDFHTSEAIPAIGASFNKEQFQQMLKKGHVDSITIFSKCHHGWAYHPSEANTIHPGLQFDLLGAMIEAAHEIDVKTPVYLSAGLDEKLTLQHPEWLVRDKQEQTSWVQSFLDPGYHLFCLNSPYLDVLLKQIEEVVTSYDTDGIFLDIVGERACYCHTCMNELRSEGLDPRDDQAVFEQAKRTYAKYTRRVNELVHSLSPGLPVFHNGGHISRGRRDLAQMNSHLELESLPTGGWGYDHFPLSARYAQTLGMPFLGMTGKFHTTWGEFGGYKHPNALRYEAALSIANGARCSIGDQMHPSGLLDEATYSTIGAAYAEVEEKEAWCIGATNVADVALLSLEAVRGDKLALTHENRGVNSDTGAIRMLLEGKLLFDVIDMQADFNDYRVLILPDEVLMSVELTEKIQQFVSNGGKVLATGRSGLNQQGDAFAIDLGVSWIGENPYKPDYFKPHFELRNLHPAAYIFYADGQQIALNGGTELGHREEPYFNREAFKFCSHQHTPSSGSISGPGMVEGPAGIYIAWNVFDDYATKGSLILKEVVLHALDRLLPGKSLATTLPVQGIVTLQFQEQEKRYVNHLLYASPVKRGNGVEVIEDLVPIHDVQVSLRLPVPAKRVLLAPQGSELPMQQENGLLTYTVPEVSCHQMVVIEVQE
ncbi:beta-galactosidase trimerization domain-containing protein [Paenibacillus eucommiae]|uniref:Beta-galactosidase trimerisation domain-containing protein n=1 Tax=Paenibacillus eucommiae TaxID=1355755 RepID=A0ABS4INH1_9BACL|nr:beta-galactosidase trimerization domain-containing protein [Paenibacillus eucommiae]MBP1989127.1 hypothetical protein [Paenibacillus eucommiae]